LHSSAARGVAAVGGISNINWLADFHAIWFWKSLKPAIHKASFHGTPVQVDGCRRTYLSHHAWFAANHLPI
jgi:hypothetical protein